jgi:Transmembrane amino acid transporter protein
LDEGSGSDSDPLNDEVRLERIRKRGEIDPEIKRNKMNGWQTFFAIIKGYTTINIFMLPIGFRCGGWLFSPIMLVIQAIFETIGAVKVTQSALKTQIYSYPDLVEYAFGRKARYFVGFCLSILSFQFTLTPLSFFTKTLQTAVKILFKCEVSIWWFAGFAIILFTLLSWVRTIERFKIGFVFAVVTIFSLVITVSVCDFIIINEHDHNAGPGWKPFNSSQYYTMVGLAFYMFEGVTSVLPVLEASDSRENFVYLVIGALATLCTINIFFSELCYYTFGDTLNEPVVILMFGEENYAIQIGKLFMCAVIVFSFPLQIIVVNHNIESFIFDKMEYSILRTWLKNFSRLIITTLAVVIAVLFYYSLHKILGLTGVLIGSVVVLIVPALLHRKIMAEHSCEQGFNWFIVVYGLTCSIVIGTLIIINWDNK